MEERWKAGTSPGIGGVGRGSEDVLKKVGRGLEEDPRGRARAGRAG